VGALVRLMRACPAEFVSIRRDLIHGIRVIIFVQPLKDAFLPHITEMLDEQVRMRMMMMTMVMAAGAGGSWRASERAPAGDDLSPLP
jgi:hypothetical protein